MRMPSVEMQRDLDLLDLGRPQRVVAFQLCLAILGFVGLLALYRALHLDDTNLGLKPTVERALTVAMDHSVHPERELHSRVCWAATILLYFGVGIAAIGNGFRVLTRILEPFPRRQNTVGALMLLAGTGLIVWACIEWRVHWGPVILDRLFKVYFETRGLNGVSFVVGLMNGTAGAAALLILSGSSACMFVPPEGGWNPQALSKRLEWLRALLFFGAAQLTLGVLSLGLLFRWMAIYAPLASDKQPFAISQIGDTVTVGVGLACSLILFVSYVPPALALRSAAEDMAVGDDVKSRNEWLERNGVSSSPFQVAVRLGSALAPLIIGSQLPSVLSGLGGQ